MNYNAANEWMASRLTICTNKSSREIAADMPPRVRAHAFFSARVAEPRILEHIRPISEAFSRGELGQAQAREMIARWLDANRTETSGWGDASDRRITNLASAGRIDLILRQNAAMGAAVGRYQVSRDPDIEERWPSWRYITGPNSRPSHKAYDGRVFLKSDPFWRTHYPPWDFNCNCDVEDSDETPGTPPPDTSGDAPDSGFAFDPAHAFEKFDMSSVKSPEVMGNIREEAEILYGDQMKFEKNNATVKFETKPYRTFEDEKLPSAKEWTPAPSPNRIDPEEARKRLETGFEVKTGDGRTAVMDQAVLDHWKKEEHKLDSDIQSRLSSLNYAVETLEHPIERWDQETQSRYLKIFQKTTGGYEGCMVVVTDDGKCRTYFLPSVSKINKSRAGMGYEVIGKDELSIGRDATQTTGTIAAPDRSDDRKNKNTPSF